MRSFKTLHLVISTLLIVSVALVYGLFPDRNFPTIFDFSIHTTNQSNIFRAIMGLYLSMAVFWIIGILKPTAWNAATRTNIFFMGGLAVGRILSLLLDGIPGIYFLIGLIIELVLAAWGIKNLKKYKDLN